MILVVMSVITILLILVGGFYTLKERWNRNPNALKKKHVLITGGSKGIGKSLAFECLKRGAHVTICARNQDVLDQVKMELLKAVPMNSGQKVMALSIDISSSLNALEQVVSEAEDELGPVYMLINCAGTSMSGTFLDTKVEEFKRMMNVNYMGTVMMTKAVAGGMKERGEGVIVLVSSVAGLIGLFGYSAYSGSKFALVGLAEVLAMELRSSNIKVCVSFPPDTDTPGFEEENKSKPKETALISESGGLFKPEVVAQAALDDALAGKFTSTVGMESWVVKTACCGMMPIASAGELIWQVMLLPILRLFSIVFLNSCYNIIDKCEREVITDADDEDKKEGTRQQDK